ncbi:hypothetical protein KR054_001846 [Drosophila jambulina]|nr:hypothetical protein KR054_001846 [Drosophila jambulina]
MLSKVVIIPLLFLPAIVALGTQVVSYDNGRMLDLIENLNGSVSEQLSLVAATWGKLRADYPRDVGKIEALQETLQHVICKPARNVTLQHNLQAHLIREHIREHLEILNTTALFQLALEAEEHDQGKWQMEIGRHSQKLHCLYKPEQRDRILQKVLRKIYNFQNISKLAALFYQLYITGNRESYLTMIHAELMLYERYKIIGQQSVEFNSYMAKLWQSFQLDDFYSGLDPATKQRLVNAIIELLKYL